jgi:hypothetical protein
MEKHALDNCPRCNAVFVCKSNNVSQCDCQHITLTFDETQYIREQSLWDFEGGCLCNACLLELKVAFNKGTSHLSKR